MKILHHERKRLGSRFGIEKRLPQGTESMQKPVYLLGLEGFSSIGGVQEYTKALAAALPEAPYRSPHDRTADLRASGMGARGRSQGDLPKPVRASVFSARLMAECLAGRVGALWATHLNLAPVCHLAQRITGVPYGVTLHGVEVWRRQPRFEAALRSATLLLPVSEFTRDAVVQRWDIPAEKLRVLYNTFDPGRFVPGERPASLMKRYGIACEDRVVLTLGRMDPRERYKGHDQMLEAIAPLAKSDGRIKYVIAGSGGDAARIAEKARELGIGRSVVMTGFVGDEDLPDLYRLCDVFAMPSKGEGFGIVYLEALASGKQVIAGNEDAGRDALAGGRFGRLVSPDSIGELREALSAALADRLSPSRRDEVVAMFGPGVFRRAAREVASLLTGES